MIIHELSKAGDINKHLGRKKVSIGPETRITESFNVENSLVIFWEGTESSDEKSNLSIGAYCSISWGVRFLLGGNHQPQRVSTWLPIGEDDKSITSNGDIIIGNDVWIGQRATILSGVTIGDGAIIGTEALVTKDVPPYTIVGGNPIKTIGKRFSTEQIDKLMKIKWWGWPEDLIFKHRELLFKTDLTDETLTRLINILAETTNTTL